MAEVKVISFRRSTLRVNSRENGFMGTMSIWHWLLVGLVALVFFGGKGKISDLMGDFGRGISSFKRGMAEEATSGASSPAGHVAVPEPARVPRA